MKPTTLLLSAAACLLTPALASAQVGGLQPESQQEFRRTFGFTPTPAAPGGNVPQGAAGGPVTTPVPAVGPQASVQPRQGLSAESVTEFRRVFGQNVVTGAVRLQNLATPATINSTLLSAMTAVPDERKYYMLWHLISVDISAIDHRANLAASPTTFHEQFGPARTARSLALIHQAMFEAANVFEHKYASTLPGLGTLPTAGASRDAAIVEAAYQVIASLYPGLNDSPMAVSPAEVCTINEFSLLTYYTCSMQGITDQGQRDNGIAIGRAIAGRIISDRAHDGSERAEPVIGKDFVPRQSPGRPDYAFTQWQADPVSQLQTALGGGWGNVRPFALTSGFQFRPTEVNSPIAVVRRLEAAAPGDQSVYGKLPSLHAVEQWGREFRLDPSGRFSGPPPAQDGFFLAQFWAYDGTANLCAPARLYNQLAAAALQQLESDPTAGYPNQIDTHSVTDIARFFALINVAMSDAAVSAWDAKYHFQFPRPVTYLRSLNDITVKAPAKWFPIGAQNTNSDQPYNITPPFPSYPSGHAVFGGALFGTLRQFLKPGVAFDFKSDEFNGLNKDVFNYVRCGASDQLTPQGGKFCQSRKLTLDCAERENADSRVWMGVHWVFDADDGIIMGNQVARQVYRTAMNPLDPSGQTVTPASHTFSVEQAAAPGRASLVCAGVNLPAGWDDADPTKGFGPQPVTTVGPL